MWVSPKGDFETRPGLERITVSAFEGAVQGGYYSAALDRNLVAAKGFLYELDMFSGVASLIGPLSGDMSRVSFLDFRGECYVASGGVLQVFDGAGLDNVTSLTGNDPPLSARFLGTWNSRLWVAGADSQLRFCGFRDPQDWGGSSEDGGGLFYVEDGDGAEISGLGLVDGQVVIFKGSKEKGPWSVSKITGTTVEDFASGVISRGVACVEGHTVANVQNDLFFVGNGGVFSLQQLENFKNPRAFPISLRIQPALNSYTPLSAVYEPGRGMYFLATSLAFFVWHMGTEGWHQWKFAGDISPSSVWTGAGDEVYTGAQNGHVYRLSRAVYADDEAGYVSSWSSGAQNGGDPYAEKYWKWMHFSLTPLGGGAASISWKKDFGTVRAHGEGIEVDGSQSIGWDGGFAFDIPGKGWDKASFISRRERLGFRARDIQMDFASTAPIRYVQAGVVGALLGRTKDKWEQGGG